MIVQNGDMMSIEPNPMFMEQKESLKITKNTKGWTFEARFLTLDIPTVENKLNEIENMLAKRGTEG